MSSQWRPIRASVFNDEARGDILDEGSDACRRAQARPPVWRYLMVLSVGLAVGGGISTWCHSQRIFQQYLQHNIRVEEALTRRDQPAVSRFNLQPAHRRAFHPRVEPSIKPVEKRKGSDGHVSKSGQFAYVTLAYDPP